MNIKNLIEAVKFQVSVKPQDDFMREVAEGLEKLYEENNRQKAEIDKLTCDYGCYKVSVTDVVDYQKEEIDRLQKLYDSANTCIDELEYALDKVGHSNTRVDYALEKYRNLVKENGK